MNTPVLVLSGPVGVGKTTVGEEVSEILDKEGVPHTFIDFDQLRYTYPSIPEDPWSNGLGLQNLESIWKNCFRRGARNLVLSTVIEEQKSVNDLSLAVPGSKLITIQLFASPETLKARVEKREIGSGLDWHKNRALELLEILSSDSVPCDFRIDTEDRPITEIAKEIVSLVKWRS